MSVPLISHTTMDELERLGLGCESFTGEPAFDKCLANGRVVFAKYADDMACWPCRVRAIINGTTRRHHEHVVDRDDAEATEAICVLCGKTVTREVVKEFGPWQAATEP